MTSFASAVLTAAMIFSAALAPPAARSATTASESPLAIGSPAATIARADLIVIDFPIGDAATRFRNDWRNRRSGGRHHEGTDIYAEKGTPIVAVADGFIRSMHSGGKGGYMLRIEHADGWETWFMHLDNDHPGTDDGKGGESAAFAAGLGVGDFVEAGQVVAFVGDSGNAESGEAHVHFELHHRGRKVNPYPQLTAAWDRYQRSLIVAGEVR